MFRINNGILHAYDADNKGKRGILMPYTMREATPYSVVLDIGREGGSEQETDAPQAARQSPYNYTIPEDCREAFDKVARRVAARLRTQEKIADFLTRAFGDKGQRIAQPIWKHSEYYGMDETPDWRRIFDKVKRAQEVNRENSGGTPVTQTAGAQTPNDLKTPSPANDSVPPAPSENADAGGQPGAQPTDAQKQREAAQSLSKALKDANAEAKNADAFDNKVPPKSIVGVNNAARQFFASGINTPEKLASLLEGEAGGWMRPWTDSVWKLLRRNDRDNLPETPDWATIYGNPKAGETPGNTAAEEGQAAADDGAGTDATGAEKTLARSVTQQAVEVLRGRLGGVDGGSGRLTRADIKKIAGAEQLNDKQLDEAVEAAIVRLAAEIVGGNEGTSTQHYQEKDVRLAIEAAKRAEKEIKTHETNRSKN
jgi:hypothetical protein